jgi:hypothetical protein
VFEWLKIVESKLGVVIGESLADDMEGCGEELVLKRACAPDGGWPKERVDIIRSSDKSSVTKGGEWQTSDVQSVQGAKSSKRRDDLELAQIVAQACTQGWPVYW